MKYWITSVVIILILVGVFYYGRRTSKSNDEQTPMDQYSNITVVLKTNKGDITLELSTTEATVTTDNFVKLSQEGFYNGTKFHRVIKGFMIQGGDPLTKDDSQMAMWGTGGPGYQFADEINQIKLERGVIAMANSGPNTNGSQFFIITAEATPWLDGKHTAFGRVTAGMEVVDAIEATPTGGPDLPLEPIVINSVEVR